MSDEENNQPKSNGKKPTHYALARDQRNGNQEAYNLKIAAGWITEGGAINFKSPHRIMVDLNDVVIVPAKKDD